MKIGVTMKYKAEKLNRSVTLLPGDSINLSFTNFSGEQNLHTEVVQVSKYYTHWLFMDIGGGIGDGVFLGDKRLEDWFTSQFPQAEKVEAGEHLFV